LKHPQRGLALGVAVGLGHHGGGDQAVAVLHQRVSRIRQVRLLAVALSMFSRKETRLTCFRSSLVLQL
jgi:hypothetical protein